MPLLLKEVAMSHKIPGIIKDYMPREYIMNIRCYVQDILISRYMTEMTERQD